MSKYREIGSEFWKTDEMLPVVTEAPWDFWPGESAFYACGRTALSVILRDALSSRPYRKAYLPSYCCETMIEPFLRCGLSVEFYPVRCRAGRLYADIDASHECDIILLMEYFGFATEQPRQLPGALVIRDMTHSLLKRDPSLLEADYLFASVRKWDAIAGAAVACKTGGKLPAAGAPNGAFVEKRRRAYEMKADYLAGRSTDKQGYLDLFAEAEDVLDTDYEGYGADEESVKRAGCLMSCIRQRQANARVLMEGLRDLPHVKTMFDTLGEGSVPLFVPILVSDGLRDDLRRALIAADVYCPNHWPLSDMHEISQEDREIYKKEISLICDQRYDEEDMRRQLEVIRGFEVNHA